MDDELEVRDEIELDLDEDQEQDSLDESSGDESKQLASSDDEDEDHAPETLIDDDDDAHYSRRVKKRIDKEVYRRKAAEEREQRISAELAALRADIDQVKSRNAAADAQAAEGTLQDKIKSARQRLHHAKEMGDVDGELDAQDEYLTLQQERMDSERQKRQQSPTTNAQQLPAGTSQWLDKNGWYLENRHPHLSRIAAELDSTLQAEGFQPTDPAMYTELNRRMRAIAPKSAHLFVDGDGAKPHRQRDNGPPTGSSSPDGAGTTTTQKRKLTNADLAEMRDFGLDPSSVEDRKVWLRTHVQ